MTKTRGKVYFYGPVRNPMPQDIPSDETLTISKAIMRAGGFGDYADTNNVKINRKGSGGKPDQTINVDAAQIINKGRTDLDVPLEPGDIIIVPERMIRF